MIKKWIEFSLTSFDILKYDCVIKAFDMFSFLSLTNNSDTTGLSFLLLIIAEILSSELLIFYVCYLYCIL